MFFEEAQANKVCKMWIKACKYDRRRELHNLDSRAECILDTLINKTVFTP